MFFQIDIRYILLRKRQIPEFSTQSAILKKRRNLKQIARSKIGDVHHRANPRTVLVQHIAADQIGDVELTLLSIIR